MMTKFFRKMFRHTVVYGCMPFFNAPPPRSRHYYLSHRPEFMKQVSDETFRTLQQAWEVGRASNNRGDWTRLYFLMSAARDLRKRQVPGAVAELGVYRGASAKVLRHLLPDRRLYLFDTFEGLDRRDLEPSVSEGLFKCSLEEVRRFVGEDEAIRYCPGYFPETASMVPEGERFALVHLDMDLYKPTKAACEYFYDRLEPGGLLIVHDYHGGIWPGVEQALDEFLADKPERPALIPDKSGTAVVVKNAVPKAATNVHAD